MELNINNLPDFVRNATILWNMAADSVAAIARGSSIFKEVVIPQNTGNVREFSEIDLEEYALRKGESDQASRAKVQQGYTKIGTLYRVSKDIGISYELRTQGKYMEIQNRLTNLGRLAKNRMELDLTHRLTFGDATSYVDMDGVTVDTSIGDTLSLFSTAHTLKGSSTTFRNRLANSPVFSLGSLEAMEKMRVENTFNQFGEKMTIKADVLWTSDDPNTVNTVRQVLRSTTNITQANAGVINPYEGTYRHVILPRLATNATGGIDSTKAKRWGLVSTTMSTAYLGVHEEPRLKAPDIQAGNNVEFSTEDWNFGTAAGYMIVVVSATWISASYGDGTA